nr:FAD-dependent monooxygenase [Streptomyces sp. NBC_00886]
MSDSVISAFDGLVAAAPPAASTPKLDTACVIGGSIAGLLAARVLSDHARRVVIIERDELSATGQSRPGVPQDHQVHTLLPAGHRWVERWLPGFTQEALDMGAVLADAGAGRVLTAFDGHPQAPSHADHHLLTCSRPFLEARIRARVLARPSVSLVRGRATGLSYRDGAVSAVSYTDGTAEHTLAADFVVDAMGRGSRLPEWISQDGYDKPALERLESPINYATALFERDVPSTYLDVPCALALCSPGAGPDGVSVAAANAVEDKQWLVMLMGYGDDRPGRTIDDFRAACAALPPVFAQATAGAVTRAIVTYHQAESRRRHFTGLERFPARLAVVGDAVASFNPVYGQGMSSAALHGSCLSAYLAGDPDLTRPATDFFALQQLVVDAAWAVSAGGDSARLDALAGVEPPEDVRRQRWALQQVIGASIVDGSVARSFNDVSYMLRHPATLADPALLERAVAANQNVE